MFEINGIKMEAIAHADRYSILPDLDITICSNGSKTMVYRIQRSNAGMPGYYTFALTTDSENNADHPIDRHIIASYLPGYYETEGIEDCPECIIRTLIRTYVLVTTANLFSNLKLEFGAKLYNTHDLPIELNRAIEKFVDLEYNQIMNK